VAKIANALPKDKQAGFLARERQSHFKKYPRLKYLQSQINRRENGDFNVIVELMAVMPYAAYNLRQYAIEHGVEFHQLFTHDLQAAKVSLLNRKTRLAEKLSDDDFAGECYAKKKFEHGLISEGERFMWVAQEQSPLIQLYTIGHELIHAAQIKEVMEMEKKALADGPVAFARFLNFYGNFLSLAAITLENHQEDLTQKRKPLYGLADRLVSHYFSPPIHDVRAALARGTDAYEQSLKKYGSLFGYMMPVGNAVRVKALREVVPALENAKNIIFAKECGLEIELDEIQSALPTANRGQVKRYRSLITEAARNWNLNFEALRVIASHQYYGVMFARAEIESQNLTIDSDPSPIFLSTGYNQTQQ
jgi:hypothetical protein